MADLGDFQIGIAVDFDSSATPPSSSNSEYSRRQVLINRSVLKWAKERDYRWPHLYRNTTLTTTPNVAYVDLPDDFEWGNMIASKSGQLTINGVQYEVISLDQKLTRESSDYYVFIAGNPAEGYKLYINPTPSAALSIPLEYYSTYLAMDATGTTHKKELLLDTDISKCPDEIFPVVDTLAQLYKDDDEGNKGLDFERQSIDKLNQMLALVNGGQENQSQAFTDVSEEEGYLGIGR